MSNENITQYICILHIIFFFSLFKIQNNKYRNGVGSTSQEGKGGKHQVVGMRLEKGRR
jgi:hypothetical protein